MERPVIVMFLLTNFRAWAVARPRRAPVKLPGPTVATMVERLKTSVFEVLKRLDNSSARISELRGVGVVNDQIWPVAVWRSASVRPAKEQSMASVVVITSCRETKDKKQETRLARGPGSGWGPKIRTGFYPTTARGTVLRQGVRCGYFKGL